MYQNLISLICVRGNLAIVKLNSIHCRVCIISLANYNLASVLANELQLTTQNKHSAASTKLGSTWSIVLKYPITNLVSRSFLFT